MRFLLFLLGWISRTLRYGATRIIGEKEPRRVENDIVQPISDFIDEVYEDSVGDAKKRILRKRK